MVQQHLMNIKVHESDVALERRFATVQVDEPTEDETVEILHGLRPRYEDHHRQTFLTML